MKAAEPRYGYAFGSDVISHEPGLEIRKESRYLPYPALDEEGNPTGAMIHMVRVGNTLLLSATAFERLTEQVEQVGRGAL